MKYVSYLNTYYIFGRRCEQEGGSFRTDFWGASTDCRISKWYIFRKIFQCKFIICFQNLNIFYNSYAKEDETSDNDNKFLS